MPHTGNHPLELHARRTFGSFSPRKDEGLDASSLKSLKDAVVAAQEFADDPRGWLVFSGGYATGKTHLAASIANQRAQLGRSTALRNGARSS